MRQHMIGHDGVGFGRWVNGAAVQRRVNRLQNVEYGGPFPMCIGCQKRVVGSAEKPPTVSIR